MTIKYGEFTFINNESSIVESMLDTLTRWITNEQQQKVPNNYIFLFEDGEICEWDNTCKDLKFDFMYTSLLPSYFSKEIKKKDWEFYFRKDNFNFDSLFHSYSKYEPDVHVKSNFSVIYYRYKYSEKLEIFGIKRIPSTNSMPRFQFAYDTDEFTKEEIIYLIHHLFT
jgi:hypothetical protein